MATTSFSSPGFKTACIILFVSSSLFFFPLSESIHFEITRFVYDTKNILYSGDAVPSAGTIELNRLDDVMRVGHVQYREPVQIWDRKSRKLSDFTTHFTFIIDTQNQSKYGDALAFFLAPVGFQIPPNSAGKYLGLFNTSNSQNQIIVVEFDTVVNPEFDPPYGHLGININSVTSAKSTPWNASLHSGDSANASVSYNATTQTLSLSLRYEAESASASNSTNLSYKVDLRDVLPEWVTIGFSGTTGVSKEKHTLQYWEFTSSLMTSQERKDNSKKWKLTVGITVPAGVLVLGGIVAYAIFRSRKKTTDEPEDVVALTSINDDLERGAGPKRFSFKDLALATNNFSNDQKLGEGGFGCVYKGYLSREGIMVAVKKVSQGSKQGKKEYTTEVKIISSLRHRNLVQLLGWCHDETGQFLLVYEFMPNESLDYHLFNKKSIIKWDVRYNIATGLASALLYLHEECEQCVVHRDIKASNIMLDSGFSAKLGDFGLARLMDHELGLKTTGLAGTLGYMAPEYAVTGKASKESDVYSFGVVALEIVCGKKATGRVDPHSDVGLVEWVWCLYGKNKLLCGVDQLLNKEFDEKEVERLMMVGLWCSHPDRSLRPSIRQAIQVLKFKGVLPNLPTKMPVPFYSAPDGSETSSSSATMTFNSVDMVR